jgi:[glutamine synthetase] adenylyltransferase / [glutamine synthetase]-adenylyl-L-tyrosine phosphorylase
VVEEAVIQKVREAVAGVADPEGAHLRLTDIVQADPSIADDPDLLRRAAVLAGASRALSASLVSHPSLLRAVPSEVSVPLRLRGLLIEIAGDELMGSTDVAEATARFSDGIDTLVSEALDRARGAVANRHPLATQIPFAVVAMGKWGARELNYYSDIDLVFVHDRLEGLEHESRTAGIAIAGRLIADLSSPTFEGSALHVDVDLRPEGTMGPLSRSLDSYRAYYERWGEAWEIQALLKARPAAGDADLGRRFFEMAASLVWEEGLDAEALRSIRLLKARAEQGAPHRDVKRAPGGIRDIEFSVQILQLVHGRFDVDVRVPATLDALEALGNHGYIEVQEAERLSDAYRFLRNIEHRIQIWDLTQNHTMPTAIEDRERIGRSLGMGADSAAELESRVTSVRRTVRDLHERLYFRPILDSLVGVESALLDPEAARMRLAALGFRDVTAASRAFEDLTSGMSRRSRVMQQVLPLMLDWLSQSPDPDVGLSQMRMLLSNTTDHSALVSLLQSSPIAGERLCMLLGNGRLLGELIDRIPEFIPRLAAEHPVWDIRDAPGAAERLLGLLEARPDPDARIGTIRRFARRRKLRIAARDVLEDTDVEVTIGSLADSADAAMIGALEVIGASEGFAVIAMGKWGGRELSYGSDVDLMYVYGSEPQREQASRSATELGRVLWEPGRHGEGYRLDAELRPEGNRGPLARSVDGFRRYYDQWAAPWELLALVKARPAAGDPTVLEGFFEVAEPVIWRDKLEPEIVREIRLIKARVESERIPPGEDPDFHLKLGPGGLSDVEFLTQLLQLEHGGRIHELRTTGTLPALRLLHEHGVIGTQDFTSLYEPYRFLTKVRLRLHLQKGQAADSLPTDPDQLARLASSLDFDRHSELREAYRMHTRRARRTFQALFYE